jgi:hypothetical protein
MIDEKWIGVDLKGRCLDICMEKLSKITKPEVKTSGVPAEI